MSIPNSSYLASRDGTEAITQSTQHSQRARLPQAQCLHASLLSIIETQRSGQSTIGPRHEIRLALKERNPAREIKFASWPTTSAGLMGLPGEEEVVVDARGGIEVCSVSVLVHFGRRFVLLMNGVFGR